MTSRYHGSKISGSQRTVVLQIWQKNKPTEKMTCITFLCRIALRNKTVVHTFSHSSTMQILLRARNWGFALLDHSLLIIISDTESVFGVTERGKISMYGNKNIKVV